MAHAICDENSLFKIFHRDVKLRVRRARDPPVAKFKVTFIFPPSGKRYKSRCAGPSLPSDSSDYTVEVRANRIALRSIEFINPVTDGPTRATADF